jgi:hypothetical protein
MIHLYADQVVFDARTFGGRAALSLGDPRVAGFVAERIADEAIAQRRDLMAYRPLLVGTARAIVSSEPFRAGFRRAVQSPRRPLLPEHGAPALSVPIWTCSSARPTTPLAARIPTKLRAGVSVGPSGRGAKALMQLVKLGHRFRRNALLAIGSGALLLMLGIAMPSDRRRALLHGGTALASVALVLFFLPPLARTALTASMSSAELRPVVAGVWDAFAGGLRLWALVLAGIGIVLASTASSYASHARSSDRAAHLEPAAGAGADVARRDPPGRSPHRARAPGGVPPDRDPAGPDGDRRRPPRIRGASGAVHAGAPALAGGGEPRGGDPRRGAR